MLKKAAGDYGMAITEALVGESSNRNEELTKFLTGAATLGLSEVIGHVATSSRGGTLGDFPHTVNFFKGVTGLVAINILKPFMREFRSSLRHPLPIALDILKPLAHQGENEAVLPSFNQENKWYGFLPLNSNATAHHVSLLPDRS